MDVTIDLFLATLIVTNFFFSCEDVAVVLRHEAAGAGCGGGATGTANFTELAQSRQGGWRLGAQGSG